MFGAKKLSFWPVLAFDMASSVSFFFFFSVSFWFKVRDVGLFLSLECFRGHCTVINWPHLKILCGLLSWISGGESVCHCRRHGFSPWSGKIPHATERLSPRATTTEPVLQSPGAATTEAYAPWSLCSARETTATRSLHTAARVAPALCNWRKAWVTTKSQHSQK